MKTKIKLAFVIIGTVSIFFATLEGNISLFERFGITIKNTNMIQLIQDIGRLLLPFIAGIIIWYIFFYIEKLYKREKI